jgi:PAS domain S-box-containing protein
LVPVLGALVAVALFASFLAKTQADSQLVNVAGHQRMLAAELGAWAQMVAIGQEEDRVGLRQRVADFDSALAALQQGGRLPEGLVEPAPAEVRPALENVAKLWGELRPKLDLISIASRTEPQFAEAYKGVETGIPELKSRFHLVLTAFDARMQRLRRQMLESLFAVAAGMGLVFVLGRVITTRYIVRPVVRLGEAARRIGDGDFSRPLEVGTRDEFSALAQIFNEMAARVERLLALDVRRKHAETIIESVPAGLLLLRDDLTAIKANGSFYRTFGLHDGVVAGRSIRDILPLEGLQRAALDVLERGEPVSGRDFELPGNGGAPRSLRVTIAATRLPEEGERLVLAVEDLTDERRLAARLRASERRFKEVVENATDGMILSCGDGRITYFNGAAEKMFGWSRDDVIGRHVATLVPDMPRIATQEDPERKLSVEGSSAPGDVRIVDAIRKDGRVFPVELATSVHPIDDELVSLCTLRDVTAQRELAAKMMQMDRMIAVGTLAAGVAHEINNPLVYVIANIEHVASALSELTHVSPTTSGCDVPDLVNAPGAAGRIVDLKEALEEARDGARRVRDIVRDLKVFSRAEDETRELLALPRVLESAINMAWNEIRHRARLVKCYAPTPAVEGNDARLGQVFLNLLINAAHAIPDGRAQDNEIRIVTRTAEGGRAVVEVHDTGCGISADVLPRIFDPFFTTKPVGQGTGLGLSICRGIVAALGGSIAVESEVGKGSVFRVTLPGVSRHALVLAPPRMTVAPGRRGRILVVDDEPLVGAALQRLLAVDHAVDFVTSGREALTRLENESFDVLLCDLMMPEITGMDLHTEVSGRFPDYARRMVFMTGGAFTPQAREFLDRVPNQRLDKPVDEMDLRALMRTMVDTTLPVVPV